MNVEVEKVEVERHGHWARIDLTAPADGAAFLDPPTIASLRSALEKLVADPSVRCLLLQVRDCLGGHRTSALEATYRVLLIGTPKPYSIVAGLASCTLVLQCPVVSS